MTVDSTLISDNSNVQAKSPDIVNPSNHDDASAALLSLGATETTIGDDLSNHDATKSASSVLLSLGSHTSALSSASESDSEGNDGEETEGTRISTVNKNQILYKRVHPIRERRPHVNNFAAEQMINFSHTGTKRKGLLTTAQNAKKLRQHDEKKTYTSKNRGIITFYSFILLI